jgi:uncharacterized protein involved in response to NO
LIDSPLRLLSAGGLVALVLAGLSLLWIADTTAAWSWFNLIYGVMAFFLFGLLLQSYPRWLHVTPVRYARFGLIFFLLAGAQLLFFCSIGWFDGPGILYLAPLLLAWALTLSTLKGMQILVPRDPWPVRGLQVLLQLTAAGLLLHLAGLLFDRQELLGFSLWLGSALMLVMLLILVSTPGHSGTHHAAH